MDHRPPALKTRPAGRGDEVERMRLRADVLRSEIGRDVFDLQSRVRETFDFRRQIAKHPLVAAAFVLGGVFLVSRIARSLMRRARPPVARASGQGREAEGHAVSHPPGRGFETARFRRKEKRG